MSWENAKLSNYLDFANGKSIKAKKLGKYPIYGSNGIIGYTNKYRHTNGIILGRVGAYCGSVEYCSNNFWGSDNTIVVANKENCDICFAYYLLKNSRLNNYAGGAAQPLLTQIVLKNVKTNFPELNVQQKIGSILSAYDDLIENNLRRIELLEQAAMELYKEWFVRLRFPGHQHTKIRSDIPENWEKKRLIEVSDITMGQSPKSIYYNTDGDGLPFHQGVKDFGTRFITHSTYCTVKNRIGESGDILFSVRAPVGRLNITLDKIVIGRGLSAIRSKINHQSFLYYQLKTYFFKEDMIGTGAIFAAITKNDLHNLELPLPDHRLIEEFQEYSLPIDEQIKNLFLQNQKLRQGRDLLLPKLMNGEVEV